MGEKQTIAVVIENLQIYRLINSSLIIFPLNYDLSPGHDIGLIMQVYEGAGTQWDARTKKLHISLQFVT